MHLEAENDGPSSLGSSIAICRTYSRHRHAEMVTLEALELDECEEFCEDERIVDRDGQFDVSVVARALRLHHAASNAPKGVRREIM